MSADLQDFGYFWRSQHSIRVSFLLRSTPNLWKDHQTPRLAVLLLQQISALPKLRSYLIELRSCNSTHHRSTPCITILGFYFRGWFSTSDRTIIHLLSYSESSLAIQKFYWFLPTWKPFRFFRQGSSGWDHRALEVACKMSLTILL